MTEQWKVMMAANVDYDNHVCVFAGYPMRADLTETLFQTVDFVDALIESLVVSGFAVHAPTDIGFDDNALYPLKATFALGADGRMRAQIIQHRTERARPVDKDLRNVSEMVARGVEIYNETRGTFSPRGLQ